MQRTKLWLIAAVIMITAGVVLLASVELVYVPRIEAYGLAAASWAQQPWSEMAPVLQDWQACWASPADYCSLWVWFC